jgi:hypothetical protein
MSPQDLTALHALCERVANHLHFAGYDTPALSLEPHLWPHNIGERMLYLQIFEEILSEQRASGGALSDHRALTWKFLKRMGLTPTSDIFDRLSDEDCLEIYNMEGDQIFRNLNVFDVVSFSIEDLVSLNWKRIFKRNQKVKLRLLDLVWRFATGHFPATYDCSRIPIHVVEEQAGRHGKIELNMKWISPLRQAGKCTGLIVISRARRLS